MTRLAPLLLALALAIAQTKAEVRRNQHQTLTCPVLS